MKDIHIYSSIPFAGKARTHFAPLLFCLLTAVAISWLSLSLYGASSWTDSIRYMNTGKNIVMEAAFSPAPMAYANYQENGAAAFGSTSMSYPSLGFSTAIGLLGLFRGDFSMANALWLNFVFCVASSVALYALAFSCLRSRPLSLAFVVLIFLHRGFIEYALQPLTDMGMFFFVCCAALAQVRGSSVAACLIFAFGYLFREVSILFLPLLPLLHPDGFTIRRYCKTCLLYCAALFPFFAVSRFANNALSYGVGNSDFYLNAAYFIASSFSMESAHNMLNHMYIFLKTSAGLPLLLCLAFWRHLPALGKRLLVVGLAYGLTVCLLFTFSRSMPERYFLQSLPFLTLAALTPLVSPAMQKRRAIALVCVALLIVAGRDYRSPALFLQAWEAGRSPAKSMAEVQSPLRLASFFPPGSLLLSTSSIGAYAVPEGVQIDLPPYEQFMAGNNGDIAGIFIAKGKRNEGWDRIFGQDSFSDASGTLFVKIDLAEAPAHNYYFMRSDLAPLPTKEGLNRSFF